MGRVRRLAYRAPGQANLHPADGTLNLPAERHSHGLRRLAAVEAARGSFAEAVAAIDRATGVAVGKRQVQELTARAAVDFEGFYAHRQPPPAADGGEVLVLQVDGKGIVMRPDALRPATAKAAQGATPKLASRLSKGEKRYRKRIAEVGAVHDATPVVRSPADILPATDTERAAARAGPIATNKWLTASVVEDAATVVARVFDEGQRRDAATSGSGSPSSTEPTTSSTGSGPRRRPARSRCTCSSTSSTSSNTSGKPPGASSPKPIRPPRQWVHDKARTVLAGKATPVAGAIRRTATNRGLAKPARKGADEAARYLTNKAANLDYPTALANGWPIATGVIEGADRHLIADRLDITGARWGLDGAEAVLRLRALRSNGDFNEYWAHHLAQERRRVHESRYVDNAIPQAA